MRDICFSVDRGGTFTDVHAEISVDDQQGSALKHVRLKLLSVDPANYPDAPREGIRRILEQLTGEPHPRDAPVKTERIKWIRMGTTVATNALLERQGARCALLITHGFRDVLHIGTQARPKIFDLSVACPGVLYERVVEVSGRVRLIKEGDAEPTDGTRVVSGVTGEKIYVEQEVDIAAVRRQLSDLKAEGIEAIAVVLMHAYTFSEHEETIAAIAKEVGFKQVTISSGTISMVKLVPRGYTATADAYLTPTIKDYLNSFLSGFDAGIDSVPVSFMQSDGGLALASTFCGFRAILSGPAGGYVGYARTAYEDGGAPVVGFDMGGTSTDVSRYAGKPEQVFEATIAGVTIQAPQLDITTVAAGGGSRFFFVEGLFQVGPESARAHPGPVCYRKGGYLATTDGNLLLGRIRPEFFPPIFGPKENEPLDLEATRAAFQQMADAEINPFFKREADRAGISHTPMSVEEIAYGFIKVANEAMCRPIREITQMRGYDVSSHHLACFGGAGGQHACAIARNLGMSRVLVHRYASILSAYGIGLADVVVDEQEAAALVYGSDGAAERIRTRHNELGDRAKRALEAQGLPADSIALERFLNVRYQGTDVGIMMLEPEDSDYARAFHEQYQREFGFRLPGRDILVDDIRVRGTGVASHLQAQELPVTGSIPTPLDSQLTYFEDGWRETPSFSLKQMEPGNSLEGPCILVDDISTILVEPDCRARMTKLGNIEIDVFPRAQQGAHKKQKLATEEIVDPIRLSVYSHRFMGIAEQMGRTLQRTAVSTNMKERLDFSCAIFDVDGGLVANAPHIPVHLGAMQEAVRAQQRKWADNIDDGDVFVSNHPQLAGGSHLPDITVITPVFSGTNVVFWVASRGHHADIGGATPGSMPPFSKSLSEEGAQIVGFKLVERGEFQETGIREILAKSRNLGDNLNDLQAQVAANNMGIKLLRELIDESSLETVQKYMLHIQDNAEASVRKLLRTFAVSKNMKKGDAVFASDQLDDGSDICLSIAIDPESGSAVFDFEGTGPELHGNLNAPPAVVYSAIVYTLRCLCGAEIPLNQGCLAPVTVKIPHNSLLHPSANAAVVGGNVLTSQRVVDVVLRAFGACAASQGCMNNLSFGDETFGYYETIAGGAGAGPTWHGRSGVHTHMTNTRITDPEILERRYPVMLREFSLRKGSGGHGRWHGGDGVVRDIEFRKPMQVSILSERRATRPYGMAGGGDGAKGQNLIIMPGGHTISLGGKASIAVEAGTRFRLLSPGGGAYGAASEDGA